MRSRLALFAFVLAPLAFLAPRAPAAASQRSIDVLHYGFELTLAEDSPRIEGRATIRFAVLDDGLEAVDLDLEAPDGSGRGMAVEAVLDGGRSLAFTHADQRLHVQLARPARAGERLVLTVVYAGEPASGLVITNDADGRPRTWFGDNFPDHFRGWLPGVDHPSDKATCEFDVVAPSRFQVVANGALVEETDLPGGRRRTRWRESVRIPTYVMVVGVGPFAVEHGAQAKGVPIQNWVFPERRETGFTAFAPTRHVIEFFSETIGPFPYEKLANVQSRTRWGGMENASVIFYNENAVGDGRDITTLIAHEVAHQWFGDSVTESDWGHIWLSEGFATYFAALFVEHASGREAFVRMMRADREQVARFARRSRRPVVDPTMPLDEILSANSYQKGGWVLHMLRRRLGDEDFRAGIRRYFLAHRDGNALTDDLRRAMEEVSGQDLAPFFEQWLYRPGHPRLAGTWRWDEGAHELVLEIAQVQGGEPFRFDLDVGIRLPGLAAPVERTVRVDGERVSVRLPCRARPAEVVLDPDCWLLFEGSLAEE